MLVDENMLLHTSFSFKELMIYTIEIENDDIHYVLRSDFMKYLWILKGTKTYAYTLLSIIISMEA